MKNALQLLVPFGISVEINIETSFVNKIDELCGVIALIFRLSDRNAGLLT